MRLRSAHPGFELGPVALFDCTPILGRGTVSPGTGQAGSGGSRCWRRARWVFRGRSTGRRRRRGVAVSRCLRGDPAA
ncbi:MAG: hypothetical protein KGK18_18515, partial [Burkholderiales bacterium]|nr:hypothetical protein [Burkholderiales bacterium]